MGSVRRKVNRKNKKHRDKSTRKDKKGGGFFSSLKASVQSGVNTVRNVMPGEKLETNVTTLQQANEKASKDDSRHKKNTIQVKLNRGIVSKVKSMASKNELNGLMFMLFNYLYDNYIFMHNNDEVDKNNQYAYNNNNTLHPCRLYSSEIKEIRDKVAKIVVGYNAFFNDVFCIDIKNKLLTKEKELMQDYYLNSKFVNMFQPYDVSKTSEKQLTEAGPEDQSPTDDITVDLTDGVEADTTRTITEVAGVIRNLNELRINSYDVIRKSNKNKTFNEKQTSNELESNESAVLPTIEVDINRESIDKVIKGLTQHNMKDKSEDYINNVEMIKRYISFINLQVDYNSELTDAQKTIYDAITNEHVEAINKIFNLFNQQTNSPTTSLKQQRTPEDPSLNDHFKTFLKDIKTQKLALTIPTYYDNLDIKHPYIEGVATETSIYGDILEIKRYALFFTILLRKLNLAFIENQKFESKETASVFSKNTYVNLMNKIKFRGKMHIYKAKMFEAIGSAVGYAKKRGGKTAKTSRGNRNKQRTTRKHKMVKHLSVKRRRVRNTKRARMRRLHKYESTDSMMHGGGSLFDNIQKGKYELLLYMRKMTMMYLDNAFKYDMVLEGVDVPLSLNAKRYIEDLQQNELNEIAKEKDELIRIRSIYKNSLSRSQRFANALGESKTQLKKIGIFLSKLKNGQLNILKNMRGACSSVLLDIVKIGKFAYRNGFTGGLIIGLTLVSNGLFFAACIPSPASGFLLGLSSGIAIVRTAIGLLAAPFLEPAPIILKRKSDLFDMASKLMGNSNTDFVKNILNTYYDMLYTLKTNSTVDGTPSPISYEFPIILTRNGSPMTNDVSKEDDKQKQKMQSAFMALVDTGYIPMEEANKTKLNNLLTQKQKLVESNGTKPEEMNTLNTQIDKILNAPFEYTLTNNNTDGSKITLTAADKSAIVKYYLYDYINYNNADLYSVPLSVFANMLSFVFIGVMPFIVYQKTQFTKFLEDKNVRNRQYVLNETKKCKLLIQSYLMQRVIATLPPNLPEIPIFKAFKDLYDLEYNNSRVDQSNLSSIQNATGNVNIQNHSEDASNYQYFNPKKYNHSCDSTLTNNIITRSFGTVDTNCKQQSESYNDLIKDKTATLTKQKMANQFSDDTIKQYSQYKENCDTKTGLYLTLSSQDAAICRLQDSTKREVVQLYKMERDHHRISEQMRKKYVAIYDAIKNTTIEQNDNNGQSIIINSTIINYAFSQMYQILYKTSEANVYNAINDEYLRNLMEYITRNNIQFVGTAMGLLNELKTHNFNEKAKELWCKTIDDKMSEYTRKKIND